MLRYVVRRLLWMVFVLWIVGSLIFFMPKVSKIGDPAALRCPRGCTPAQIELIRTRLGLADPVITQYKRFWIGDKIGPEDAPERRGVIDFPPSFGYSFRNDQPVLTMIIDRVPVTAALALGAAVMWLLMGIPIGILAATKPRSFRDRAATLFALTGVSMPTFFLGIVMLYVFFLRFTKWGIVDFDGDPWFPPGYRDMTESPIAWLRGLILPCFTLAFVNAAVYSRMVRGTMLEVLGEDYIRTARAKGLSNRRVVYRHALRSSLTPVVTLLGLDVGALLGGAVITERIFGFQGVGALLIQAIFNLDVPIIIGAVLFASFFVVIANIIVDIVYAMLDPRVRYS